MAEQVLIQFCAAKALKQEVTGIREKIHFKEKSIQMVLTVVKDYGVAVIPHPMGEISVDIDDLIFYEVAMEKREDDAYLGAVAESEILSD